MPGSGKGTCTDYLSHDYGYPLIHFGNMVYEEVARRGLDNIADEKFVREDMRAKEGPTVLAIHAARKAQTYIDDGSQVVVLDGLYSWSEYKYLHLVFGSSLLMIAVTAPRQVRYQRILARQDGHRKYTDVQQIIDREIAEIENLEKGGPIAYADYTLDNSLGIDQLKQDLTKVLQTEQIIS